MVTRRDLRAERDFFSPMTGNTGTKIRYADAPRRKDTYGSEVKKRLADIKDIKSTRVNPIEAVFTKLIKTEDPFTQIDRKKSYAPEEEQDGLQEALGGAAETAEQVVGDAVGQVKEVVRSTGQRASERRAAQQLKRQQEREADLKAAESARQNIRTDFQNRVKGVSDEVSGVRQQVKTYESNREKQRQLTQARLKGIESDVSGVRSDVKAYESNREKQRQLTQARLKGIESKQETTAKETKDYRDRREQMRLQRQEAVDKRLGEQDKTVGEVKTNLATTFGGMVGLQKSLADIKARQEAPKTVTIGGQTVAAKQSVASLPSNYKATEAEAFRAAKAYKEAKAIAERNPNVSVSVDSKGKPVAKAEQKTRSEAGTAARTAQGNAARVQNNARARAQAAAVNRKLSGRSISQTKAANQASMRAKAAERHASFKKAKAAGTHARTASAQRARNKAAAKARAKAAAKRRRSKKKCDITIKYDISTLTNMNLLRDDLANVAYFVKELQETI